MGSDPYFDDYEDDFEDGDFDGDDFEDEGFDEEGHFDGIDEAFEEAFEEEEEAYGEHGVRELGDEFEQWNEGFERSSDDGWFYDDEDGGDFDGGFGEFEDDNY
ncbi:MAG: hypothetical protein Q4A06_08915 [Cardiobacteriaceae bacterium]|nr:hypothetical protein [Cardiobacteriaceae bacterium]